MARIESAVVKAQLLGDNGDEALYRGNWVLAGEKYVEAAAQCAQALTYVDKETEELVTKLLHRYTEKAQLIQDYLQTSHFENPETPQQSFVGVAWPDASESFMPFGNLLHGEDSSHDVIMENTTNQPSTLSLTNVLSGLASFFSRYVAPAQPAPAVEVDLDSSFVLLSSVSDIEETDKGARVTLNDEPSIQTQPNPSVAESENVALRQELLTLKKTNQGLQETNSRYQEKLLRMNGMQGLIRENTQLKKSCMVYRNQVQQSRLSVAGGTFTQPGGSPLKPIENPNRVAVLEQTIENLYRQLEAKDTRIKELEKIEIKWEKLKQDARLKRKIREEGGVSGVSGVSATSASSGLWLSESPSATTDKKDPA